MILYSKSGKFRHCDRMLAMPRPFRHFISQINMVD